MLLTSRGRGSAGVTFDEKIPVATHHDEARRGMEDGDCSRSIHAVVGCTYTINNTVPIL